MEKEQRSFRWGHEALHLEFVLGDDVQTDIGERLRHRSHHAARDGDWHTLTAHLHDPETGLAVP